MAGPTEEGRGTQVSAEKQPQPHGSVWNSYRYGARWCQHACEHVGAVPGMNVNQVWLMLCCRACARLERGGAGKRGSDECLRR